MRVLVADDDPIQAEATARSLRPAFHLEVAPSKTACVDLLRANEFHVLVACERLSDGSGLELLSQVQRRWPDVLRILAIEPARMALLGSRLGPFKLFQALPYPLDPARLKSILELAQAAQDANADTANVQHIVLGDDALREVSADAAQAPVSRPAAAAMAGQSPLLPRPLPRPLPPPLAARTARRLGARAAPAMPTAEGVRTPHEFRTRRLARGLTASAAHHHHVAPARNVRRPGWRTTLIGAMCLVLAAAGITLIIPRPATQSVGQPQARLQGTGAQAPASAPAAAPVSTAVPDSAAAPASAAAPVSAPVSTPAPQTGRQPGGPARAASRAPAAAAARDHRATPPAPRAVALRTPAAPAEAPATPTTSFAGHTLEESDGTAPLTAALPAQEATTTPLSAAAPEAARATPAVGVREARLLKRTIPLYPRAAAAAGVQGTVELGLTITATGKVQDVQVISATPPHTFDEAAAAAVRRWKYEPRAENGVAVDSRTLVRLEFRLAD